MPPLAVTVCAYAAATLPLGSVVAGLTTTLAAVTLKENGKLTENGAPVPVEESVTLIEKLKDPPDVGVPLNTPVVLLKVIPAGSVPVRV